MTAPTLSIGMPVYNGGQYLRRALDSVLAQTFTDFECILSDNASTDDTAAICLEYAARDPRLRYIRQPSNIGGIPNFEFTLREATGEFFFWAAHDDWRVADFASTALAALQREPSASGAMGRMYATTGDAVAEPGAAPPYHLSAPGASHRIRSYIRHKTPDIIVYGVFRRSVLLKAMPFVKCTCPEKLIIMRTLIEGAIIDVPAMAYFAQIIEKDPVTLANTIGIDAWNDANELKLFFSMVSLLREGLRPLDFLLLLPQYMLANNWHRFFVRLALRKVRRANYNAL